ncbi:MAG: ribonuclease domain-containing protein [Mycobacterium sp.]
MSRGRWALVTLGALIVLCGGWASTQTHPSDPPAVGGASGSTCQMASLPAEVRDTVRRIHTGGPFPFPRSDGAVFANREGHLPEQRRGYYHEYTVITPRSQDRSMRRIVTGGTPLTDPNQYFYTGNHYDSFCVVTGAGRQ